MQKHIEPQAYRVALATYRKFRKGFISMRDLSIKDITLISRAVFFFACNRAYIFQLSYKISASGSFQKDAQAHELQRIRVPPPDKA